MDNGMKEAVQDFITAIKSTEEYLLYKREKERVSRQPEIKQQIDEYRRRNFEMQTLTEDDELFDKMEQFEAEYADFMEIPIVNDFLDAELAFCRMMQEVNVEVTGALDFD